MGRKTGEVCCLGGCDDAPGRAGLVSLRVQSVWAGKGNASLASKAHMASVNPTIALMWVHVKLGKHWRMYQSTSDRGVDDISRRSEWYMVHLERRC